MDNTHKRREAVRKWQDSQLKKGLCMNHSIQPIAQGNARLCQICVDKSLERSKTRRESTWSKLMAGTRCSFTIKDIKTLKRALSELGVAVTTEGLMLEDEVPPSQ